MGARCAGEESAAHRPHYQQSRQGIPEGALAALYRGARTQGELRRHRAALWPQGSNVATLPALIAQHLPVSPAQFPEDQLTDRNPRFQAAEIIREKLTWRLRQELP